MAKVIAVCGKICSGKTYYCTKLKEKDNGILLSCDEILSDLFHHNEGNHHDAIVRDIKGYLRKKAVEIVGAGCDVILDWGFWPSQERKETTEYFESRNIHCEWHYIDIKDEDWFLNIEERNRKVSAGVCPDYFVDEGLLKKVISLFEAPVREEMDIWYCFSRD